MIFLIFQFYKYNPDVWTIILSRSGKEPIPKILFEKLENWLETRNSDFILTSESEALIGQWNIFLGFDVDKR